MNICQLALSVVTYGTFFFNLFNVNNYNLNSIALDKADDWNELLFKEALLIKWHKPSLNTSLNTLEGLQLF